MSEKRISFKKDVRERVKAKTNGRCGYCGVPLDRFHIDHIIPLAHSQSSNDESNLMASCASCNSYKSSMSLEQFRQELAMQAFRAIKRSVNVRMAVKFGLIVIKPKRIVFYFEGINK